MSRISIQPSPPQSSSTGNAKENQRPKRNAPHQPQPAALPFYSQSSSLSSSLRASFGLLGAWLGLPELAPTTS